MTLPLLPIVIALMLGILLGTRCPAVPPVFFAAGGVFLLAALLSLKKQKKALFALFILPGFLVLGTAAIQRDLDFPSAVPWADGTARVMEGMVAEDPLESEDRKDLVLSSLTIWKDGVPTPVSGRVLLSVREPCAPFRYGDVVRTRGTLKVPRNFNNPGGFDYRRFLLSRGIALRGHIWDGPSVVLIRRNGGNHLRAVVERVRDRVGTFIDIHEKNERGALLKALLIGEKRGLPEDVRESFNRAGISHVLAISGLHVGLVALFVFFLAESVLKRSETILLTGNLFRLSAAAAILPVVFYALIAGLGVPVVRATVMTVLFLFAVILGKSRSVLNVLAFAAFVVLLADPSALFDASFQLSFIAVASILLLVPAWNRLFPARKTMAPPDSSPPLPERAARRILLLAAVTMGATLGTLPLVAIWFHRLSTVSLLSNLAAVPVIGFVTLPLGLAAVFLLPLGPWVSLLFLKAAAWTLLPVLAFTKWISAFSFSSPVVATPAPWALVLYYGLLLTGVFLAGRIRQEKPKAPFRLLSAACFAIALIFLLIQFFPAAPERETLRLTAVDVGQGTATLVEFPGKAVMLVDGGGFHDNRFDVGRYVVAPFLLSRKIRTLDVVVLSHPHHDHLNGLLYILDHFTVREVWANGEAAETGTYRLFLELLEKRGIPYRKRSARDDPVTIGGVTVSFLNPDAPLHGLVPETADSTTNDRSLVLRLAHENVRFLLPGDISERAEKKLLRDIRDLECAVLLAPHHGSSHSSCRPFLKKVRPRHVIMSLGFENPFRFPSSDILARYDEIGAAVHRTDLDGAVTVESDGRRLWTASFLDRASP